MTEETPLEADTTPIEPTIKTRGNELYHKVKARQAELEKSLAIEKKKLSPGEPYIDRTGLATALSNVANLLTGDPTHIKEPTATHLSQWLEDSRLLPPAHTAVEPSSESTK
jgi:hypothetical protein